MAAVQKQNSKVPLELQARHLENPDSHYAFAR